MDDKKQRPSCAAGGLNSGFGSSEDQSETVDDQKQCDADVVHSGFKLSVVDAPTADKQQERAKCEADVLNHGKPEEAKAPDNIADATKAALACEWIDANGVDNILAAFHFLTTGPRTVSLSSVVHILEKGDPYPSDECLYSAVMGDHPVAQGLSNFLDVLAKANTLKKKAPEDEDELFDRTSTIMQTIFGAEQGKRNLLQINDSFVSKNNYVAVRQLLEAYPRGGIDKESYAKNLEQLRAAFEMNPDKLAKQVAAKITGAKN